MIDENIIKELKELGFTQSSFSDGGYTIERHGVRVQYYYKFLFYSYDILRKNHYKVYLQRDIEDIPTMKMLFNLLTDKHLIKE